MTTNKNAALTKIKDATKAAKAAYDEWAFLTPSKRAALLYDYSDLLEKEVTSVTSNLNDKEMKTMIQKEFTASAERIFWYAGWCDKLSQVYSSINPVPSDHVSITSTEPMGVVAVLSPKNQKLVGFFTAVLPIIVAGNSVVVVIEADKECDIMNGAVALLEKAGLPKGLVNVIFGDQKSLGAALAATPEVAGIAIHSDEKGLIKAVRDEACKTIKYMEVYDDSSEKDLTPRKFQSPYRILPFVEFKTTWHPVSYIH